jgi:hypothetical protein
MDDGAEDSTQKPSFLYPGEKLDILKGFAKKRGKKYPYSYIIAEACDQYIERRLHPEVAVKQMKQELLDDPSILGDYIRGIVREEVHSEFQRVFGEKYHPKDIPRQ